MMIGVGSKDLDNTDEAADDLYVERINPDANIISS
jgi:hypothetical protein